MFLTTFRFAGLINYRQLEAGTVCMLLGVLVYVIARPDGALFLPQAFNLGHIFPAPVRALAGPLPVFFHVLGLSLLSSAVLAPGKFTAVGICLGWAIVNGAFEVGQHATIYIWLEARLPVALHGIWPFEQILRYFHHGTFDPADLGASSLAAAIAYSFIRHKSCVEGNNHEHR